MGFNCGIVGLPNVGKSTLFNALTSTINAEAANYPFCTIEPNKGIVTVPDDRLDKLAAIANAQKIIPTQIEFIDIAGLVKGASTGEGLGNKFLAHIREVDAIIQVLRCFEDDDITHVEGNIDPIRDINIIENELILADLESVEKRLSNLRKKKLTGDKLAAEELRLLEAVHPLLEHGKFARQILTENICSSDELRKLNLITSKPIMYVLNVEESAAAVGNDFSKKVSEYAKTRNIETVVISSKIEEEIANLEDKDAKKEFLNDMGLAETGLAKIIKTGYNLLDLVTFFTVGVKEARAWTVKENSSAPQAAGAIHTDFEKGFIRAETIAYKDYIEFNGEVGAKEVGKLRLEGKEYIVKDGDVLHFRFNV